MSDALLTEISAKLSALPGEISAAIHAVLGAKSAPKTDDAPAAEAPKAAPKPKPAPKPKAEAAAPKAEAPAPAPKAAGGKHSIEEIRDILRKVAMTDGLGKTVAFSILEENGGVDHLTKLKPENFDAVYEAAQVELSGAEKTAEADDGLGL